MLKDGYIAAGVFNKSNHFYLGDYHVQTTPLFLEPHSGRYAVKLRVYGKFGALGQVEEEIGSLDVDGVLSGKGQLVYFEISDFGFRNHSQPFLCWLNFSCFHSFF